MKRFKNTIATCGLLLLMVLVAACAGRSGTPGFRNPNMDFGAIRTVVVLPFENLTTDKLAAERVRDTFMNALLATGAIYVIPPGEVARGATRAAVVNPVAPSLEELKKLLGIVKADAVVTGVVQEYGAVRSGQTSANVISLSVKMIEGQALQVIWAASSTKGGITFWDRLLGGGGAPMNRVTQAAIDDLLAQLFQ